MDSSRLIALLGLIILIGFIVVNNSSHATNTVFLNKTSIGNKNIINAAK